MTHLLSNDIIRAIGWTLIHSLWQGLVLALVAGILILFTRKAKPALRYNIFTALFFLLVGCAALTFVYELQQAGAAVEQVTPATVTPATGLALTPQVTTDAAALPQPGFSERFIAYFNEHTPLLVMLWFIIFVARSLWLFGGLVYLQRIRHYRTVAPDALLVSELAALAVRLGLRRKVQLLESAIVKAPMALGMLKPVILMPLGLMAQLPADQVEAVLLHELAHIRRRDFLVNLIQHFAETVFFFNPALLWLSARIREEREHCCDDMAINVTQSRTGYIQALVSFQEYQLQPGAKYAMAFPGRKKQLLGRVKRILGNHNKPLNIAEKSFLLLCFSLIGMLGLVFSQPEKKQPLRQPLTEQVTRENERHESVEQDGNRPESSTAETAPAPEADVAVAPNAETPGDEADYYNYDKPEGVTEGATLQVEKKRNGKPYMTYLYKRGQVLYQAETDESNTIARFKANGKEVYRKGDDPQLLTPYHAAVQVLYKDYKQPYRETYQPYQPQWDTVPVLRKGTSVMSGTVTTTVNGTQYKISIDNNRTTGLIIDGVKVPDEELPSKYPVISDIFRGMERDYDAAQKERRLQEAQRLAEEKIRESAAQQLQLNQQQLQLQQRLQPTHAQLATTGPVSPVAPMHAPRLAPSAGPLQPTAPAGVMTIRSPQPALSPVPATDNLSGYIVEDLLKDGIITQKDKLSFQLNKETFIVNDKPQPEAVRQKYQRKYIKSPTDTYSYHKNGNHTTTHINID